MDLNMPKMDGASAIELIRSRDGEMKNVSIIVLSVFGSKKTREKCFLLGVNEFMIKPVDFPKFETMLRKLKLI